MLIASITILISTFVIFNYQECIEQARDTVLSCTFANKLEHTVNHNIIVRIPHHSTLHCTHLLVVVYSIFTMCGLHVVLLVAKVHKSTVE